MNENESLIAKLKNVGNPVFLLKMSYDLRKFLQHHQVDFPQTGDFDRVYIEVSGMPFECYQAGVAKLELMHEKGSVIRMSRDALIGVANLFHTEFEVKDDESLLSSLLIDLRKVRHIKQYKNILMIIDQSFETNLRMKELIKTIINQLR